MTLPGLAGTPAADARLLEGAHESGRLAVDLVQEGRTIGDVITAGSFTNAIVALAAVGGSTNAVVHLLAIAGRLGIELTPRRLRPDRRRRAAARQPPARRRVPDGGPVPTPAGCSPCSREVRDLLDPTPITVTGRPLVDYLDDAADLGRRGHHAPRERPLLRPMRASRSCAATSRRAARSSSRPPRRRTCCTTADRPSSSTRSRTSTPASTTPTSTSPPTRCSILRGCGPMGYPGMPEVANLPLPQKLLQQGVRDMVRICDGRMSRHGVRHRRAARRARGRRRRLARPSSRTVTSSCSTWRTGRCTSTSPHEELARRTPPQRARRRLRQRRPRLGAALHRPRPAGRHRRRPRLPRRRHRVRRSHVSPTDAATGRSGTSPPRRGRRWLVRSDGGGPADRRHARRPARAAARRRPRAARGAATPPVERSRPGARRRAGGVGGRRHLRAQPRRADGRVDGGVRSTTASTSPSDPSCSSRRPAWRVVGPGEPIGIRADSDWDVPEPELALVFTATGELFGYVPGNDMSAAAPSRARTRSTCRRRRSTTAACALGPAIVPAWAVARARSPSGLDDRARPARSPSRARRPRRPLTRDARATSARGCSRPRPSRPAPCC